MTIKRTTGGKFILKSSKGKNLSKPGTKKEVAERERQVEYFKHKGKK